MKIQCQWLWLNKNTPENSIWHVNFKLNVQKFWKLLSWMYRAPCIVPYMSKANWYHLKQDSLSFKATKQKRRRGAMGSVSDSWSVDASQSWDRALSKAPVVSLSKKLYSDCLVLIGSRNWFELDLHKQIIACFTIKLKQISIN